MKQVKYQRGYILICIIVFIILLYILDKHFDSSDSVYDSEIHELYSRQGMIHQDRFIKMDDLKLGLNVINLDTM